MEKEIIFYKRINLPYSLNSLEPIISSFAMNIHYEILHKKYEKNLANQQLAEEIKEKYPILEQLLKNIKEIPLKLRRGVRFFGGGLSNHNFFFSHLTKPNSQSIKEI